MQVHNQQLPQSFNQADAVYFYSPVSERAHFEDFIQASGNKLRCFSDIEALVAQVVHDGLPGDHILVMSNGGFGGIHDKILGRLANA